MQYCAAKRIHFSLSASDCLWSSFATISFVVLLRSMANCRSGVWRPIAGIRIDFSETNDKINSLSFDFSSAYINGVQCISLSHWTIAALPNSELLRASTISVFCNNSNSHAATTWSRFKPPLVTMPPKHCFRSLVSASFDAAHFFALSKQLRVAFIKRSCPESGRL